MIMDYRMQRLKLKVNYQIIPFMREGVIYVLVCRIYNLTVYLPATCAYSFTNWHSLQGACNTKEVKFICTLNRCISLM